MDFIIKQWTWLSKIHKIWNFCRMPLLEWFGLQHCFLKLQFWMIGKVSLYEKLWEPKTTFRIIQWLANAKQITPITNASGWNVKNPDSSLTNWGKPLVQNQKACEIFSTRVSIENGQYKIGNLSTDLHFINIT